MRDLKKLRWNGSWPTISGLTSGFHMHICYYTCEPSCTPPPYHKEVSVQSRTGSRGIGQRNVCFMYALSQVQHQVPKSKLTRPNRVNTLGGRVWLSAEAKLKDSLGLEKWARVNCVSSSSEEMELNTQSSLWPKWGEIATTPGHVICCQCSNTLSQTKASTKGTL